MPSITPYLSVERGNRAIELRSTDAYGHINGLHELDLVQCASLIAGLEEILAAEGVEVVDVECETVPATDWDALTKAEIIHLVHERFGILLDEDLRKSALVQKAIDLEEAP